MILRYLENVTLEKSEKAKQDNGSYVEKYTTIEKYQVQVQELDDNISASIYGASIVNMLRMKSPLNKLEEFLSSKINNNTDNISKYRIEYKNKVYKIKSVNRKGIEIELI